MTRNQLGRRLAHGFLAAVVIAAGVAVVQASAAGGPNLAIGKPVTASGSHGEYPAGNVNDGNQATYWESPNHAFPHWVQVDLGAAVSIDQVKLKLPTPWEARTQTLSVQGSVNGTSFTALAASGVRAFAPSGNTATIDFPAASARYVRVHITANTGWPAGQLSEFEIYGTAGADTQAPTAPGDLTYTQTGEQIRLAWNAATDDTAVTGYLVYRNNTLAATVAGTALAYVDTQPTDATVEYFVRARDAAGNLSGDSNRVTRQGSGGGDTQAPSAPGSLAFTEPAPGQVRLTWAASSDNVGVTGYTVYANGSERGTVAGNVRTYTDTQPTTATVEYFVRARDAAGNPSPESNRITRVGQGGGGNLAAGKPVEASSSVFSFVAANATDGDIGTYWESNGLPASLTVKLGANADVSSVTVKLNPDPIWGPRTQAVEVLGREQSASGFASLKARADYAFSASGNQNSVTIPVSGRAADVRLQFSTNTGAPGAQVAELQVNGTMAPNPDLTVGGIGWTPANPDETSAITLSATVRNTGTGPAPATTADFSIGGAVAGTANVPALAAGAQAEVSADAGRKGAGSYAVSAVVDPSNTVVEQNDANNSATATGQLVVAQAPGPDLEVVGVTSSPPNPAVGAAVSFAVSVRNRGTTASGASVTRVVVGSTTLSADTASIAAGATASVSVPGTWTASAGGATITATADATGVVAETNETNNAFSRSIVVGRGAAVPYTSYEAEDGRYEGQLLVADPLRTFGHTNFASESSGRESVRLTGTGQFVEITSTNQSNSIVVRNSIPDAPGGGGIEKTISLYVDDVFARKITLSSRHSWLYGNTDGPESLTNSPQADARRLFDESHALLGQSYPPGTRFKLQRDAGDDAAFYIIDLVDLEQVAPPTSQPPGCVSITQYGAVPDDGQDDTAAIQRAVTDDQNGVIGCVWIPAGQWRQEQKILTDDPQDRGTHNQVGIRDVTIRGAGMWHSQLYTLTQPQDVVGGINHPHEGNFGFDIDDNTQISDIAIFGSGRIRGGDGNAEGGVGLNGRFGHHTKISNVWIEHANVGVWVGRDFTNIPELWNPGDGVEFTGMRIRNTYADGINFANGTSNSRVFNSSFRTTGDDALAVWASRYVRDPSVDIGHDNAFTNNTIQLPWRANGIAIYGGYGNKIENNLVYDTANYPAIMLATDHDPLPFSGTTLIANNGLYRTGGAFWGEQQQFGAITLFAQNLPIPGVTIRDTDIHDSTYDGIQFKTGGGEIPNVAITNVRIDKSNNGGAGILAHGGARGSATLTDVTITNSSGGDVVVEPGSQFRITGTPERSGTVPPELSARPTGRG